MPDDWIDVQTIADLEEVSFDIRSKRNSRLRVATKYPNLTNDFLISKGVTQYKLVLVLAPRNLSIYRFFRNHYRYNFYRNFG